MTDHLQILAEWQATGLPTRTINTLTENGATVDAVKSAWELNPNKRGYFSTQWFTGVGDTGKKKLRDWLDKECESPTAYEQSQDEHARAVASQVEQIREQQREQDEQQQKKAVDDFFAANQNEWIVAENIDFDYHVSGESAAATMEAEAGTPVLVKMSDIEPTGSRPRLAGTGANIYQRMSAVMAEVQQLEHGGQNEEFTFVTHGQVSEAARHLMCKHGVLPCTTVDEFSQEGYRSTVEVITEFVNIDDPTDSICTKIPASSDGTFSIAAAITQAVKVTLAKAFCIPYAGDNPEDTVKAAMPPLEPGVRPTPAPSPAPTQRVTPPMPERPARHLPDFEPEQVDEREIKTVPGSVTVTPASTVPTGEGNQTEPVESIKNKIVAWVHAWAKSGPVADLRRDVALAVEMGQIESPPQDYELQALYEWMQDLVSQGYSWEQANQAFQLGELPSVSQWEAARQEEELKAASRANVEQLQGA